MSARVIQCRECGRLFQSFGTNICPNCAEELDKCYKVVKNYIYDNPDANVLEVSKNTGVSEKMVLSFLRDGRLSIENIDNIFECERCGKPIPGGRYCTDCQSMLQSALSSAVPVQGKKKDTGNENSGKFGKMHFDYRDNKRF